MIVIVSKDINTPHIGLILMIEYSDLVADKLNMRYSSKLSKQLLYIRIRKYLSQFQKGTAIDIGCNKMKSKRLYRTDEYIGVDIDASSISEGQAKFSDAKGIVSDLQNLTITGDVVGCFQMIGVNTNFDKTYGSDYLRVVDDLVKRTNKGGSLIFNVGGNAIRKKDEIRERLQKEFEKVYVEEISFPDNKMGIKIALPIAILANRGLLSSFNSSVSSLLFVGITRI